MIIFRDNRNLPMGCLMTRYADKQKETMVEIC
jgi:hypothetical protein